MIMAARTQNIFENRKFLMDDKGQSVMEFLLLLPIVIILSVIFVRVNSAIQISIVNQKYARAQALWLAFNSPWFPRRDLLPSNFIVPQYNQMVIGMSDEQVSGTNALAKATEQVVIRDKSQALSGPTQEEPAQRSIVRVRTTVAMCTAPMFAATGTDANYYTPNLWNEATTPDLCRGQGGQ